MRVTTPIRAPMANEDQLRIIRERGVVAWNEWRIENADEEIDLYRVDLSGSNLWNANLRGADLREANLERAESGTVNL